MACKPIGDVHDGLICQDLCCDKVLNRKERCTCIDLNGTLVGKVIDANQLIVIYSERAMNNCSLGEGR